MPPAALIRIDGQRRLSVSIIVAVTIGGALVSTTLAWAAMTNRLTSTEESVKSTETRITAIERRMDTDIAEIKTDLRWLKDREQARAGK